MCIDGAPWRQSTSANAGLKYSRVLFKVSGEALMGDQEFGIDPESHRADCSRYCRGAANLGREFRVVVGGGNIFRGVALAAKGADRVTGDHMGMLATVMNANGDEDGAQPGRC